LTQIWVETAQHFF